MTRTQYYVAASLDGYIADSAGKLDWLFQFNDAEGVTEHYQAFIDSVGPLAMGSATYEFILGENQPWSYADRPTWVFTHRTLPAIPGANLHFTTEDVGAVHSQMVEAAAGKNIWLIGGGNLVAQFARRGLLDEILLGVIPVVLGSGIPVLPAALPSPLELTGLTRLGRGMVELRYTVPSRPPAPKG
ncbi:dihydrofolate reductase family protein [Stigmatella sp. ncwal1]|uniref:Dihydrofolate reductase family protein n=1 Tax=Stigmatella ashevillensis TaxID=2995309 RepID=A0ABT5D9R0_9BACT|nr:dihydrofolate reductase family protein [Stigmatella ashevillena]MDC0710414.1 dihydrofolate reductase family protein [Stigmatella ashevillena]